MLVHNVAEILKSPSGAAREIVIDDVVPSLGTGSNLPTPVQGSGRFVRTTEGVLVQGHVAAEVDLECSRCLKNFAAAVDAAFVEEFRPSVNVVTGEPLPQPEDQALRIDERHVLDLTETVRQYLVTALPFKPLCQPDCRGLCPLCGADLNLGLCSCADEPPIGPFTALAALAREGPEAHEPQS